MSDDNPSLIEPEDSINSLEAGLPVTDKPDCFYMEVRHPQYMTTQIGKFKW